MKPYKKLFVWQTRNRIKLIHEFHNLAATYFSNAHYDSYDREVKENAEARQARVQLNLMLPGAARAVYGTGIVTQFTYTPPPVVGGFIRRFDLFYNLFDLLKFEAQPDQVLDALQRAAAVYIDDCPAACFRTFNPIFWVARLIEYVVGIPFRFLGTLGLDESKAETSR